MAYVLGPKNFMRGERNDDGRLKKLELQVAELTKRVDAMTLALALAPIHPPKRGPGRPPKDKEAA